jgi:hypothetical protein
VAISDEVNVIDMYEIDSTVILSNDKETRYQGWAEHKKDD